MTKRPRIKLVPLGDLEHFRTVLFSDEPLTLRQLLSRAPALSPEPIDEAHMACQLGQLHILPVEEPWDRPLYRPPGMAIWSDPAGDGLDASPKAGDEEPTLASRGDPGADLHPRPDDLPQVPHGESFPDNVSDGNAVRLAYAREIESAASFLRAGLSVLVVCDKLVVEHLWPQIAGQAHLVPAVLTVPDQDEGGLVPRGLRQRQLAFLKQLIKQLKDGDVLVIPHLDLLVGGSDTNLTTESTELIELAYAAADRLLLAFADRSLAIPEVLAARFAVRLLISGVPRTVIYPNGEDRLIGKALVTAEEVTHFDGFDPEDLYKNVAGMNPVRLRHAMKYAKEYAREQGPEGVIAVGALYQAIRAFKAQTSAKFEVPDITFDYIGGYEDVKAELGRALRLMAGLYDLPDEKLRRELIPRGFIFHGPPGTGKTLFAKAIANQLNATIQVVSGPEVMDMYVGESERKVRDLFSEARRNAPAVLVFDEFDSIATKREGRGDGGARAGNAVVAQILTEMDGFRPDVPMLVIGTTNRLDIVDPALLRPSRFKAISIGLPNRTARRAIAGIHAGHYGIDASPELLEIIAELTEGMSGDDIQSLFRDARIGQLCEEIPADAYRFGMLVGALRRATEERMTGASAHRPSALEGVRPGQRPRPTSLMVPLGADPQTAESSDEPTDSDSL